MPHIHEIYRGFESCFAETVVMRLLGGKRSDIEEKTKGMWNSIVDPKRELPAIVDMIKDLRKTRTVFVNVNNHYEGCAPLTIKSIEENLDSSA